MTDKTVVVPVELLNQVRKVCSWRLLMSYNESYFGEPEGELKAAIAAIERLMPIDAAPTPPAEHVQTAMVPVEQARETLWREWGIDGMPKDKQRLAAAAFKAGLAAAPSSEGGEG